MPDPEINGRCDSRFESVLAAFTKNFRLELELGAAFAVFVDGEPVVDLWSGHADEARTHQWRHDTIAPVASNSKIACTLCGLMLVERGHVELDKPVADYWPEFAAAGKSKLPVRYIFNHSIGLPGIKGTQTTFESLKDRRTFIEALAAEAPWWEPGSQSGYHSMTYGLLLGELVQRTTGKSIDEFFRSEVAEPLNIDFHFLLDEADFPRVASIKNNDKGARIYAEDSIAGQTQPSDIMEIINSKAFFQLNLPSGSGISNARALAKIGSIFACEGELEDTRLLSPELVVEAGSEQMYTEDLVMLAPVRWGLGLGLASKEIPIPFQRAMHWGGYGGSTTVMIPEKRAAFSYTPTLFDPAVFSEERSNRLNAATVGSLMTL